MTRLIGICGQGPKSGKSTAGNILYDILYKDDPQGGFPINEWDKRYFAEGAKKIIADLTKKNPVHLNRPEVKDEIAHEWETSQGISRTYRDLIIDVANGLRDRVREDIWVKMLFNDWTKYSHWIIDDVRFIPEAKKIKEEGGIIIKIVNYKAEEGEMELPNEFVDYYVDNNTDLEYLEHQLEQILKTEKLI